MEYWTRLYAKTHPAVKDVLPRALTHLAHSFNITQHHSNQDLYLRTLLLPFMLILLPAFYQQK